MKKSEFLDGLCQGLRFHTDPDEIQHMVDFYSQAIDDRMEDGMTEDEAVAAMGDLDYIIREARNAWDQERASGKQGPAEDPAASRSFSALTLRRVDIFDSSGLVRLLPSLDGDVHVECSSSGRWRYDMEDTGSTLTIRRARIRDSEDRMDFDVFGRRFSIPMPDLGGLFDNELRLTVMLPQSTPMDINVNVASGDVRASGVRLASLYVKSASGGIEAEHVTGNRKLSLITASGDTDLSNVSAPEIVISTVSGDVDGHHVNCASLGIKTVSGDIDLNGINATRRVSLYTVSGDTDLELAIPCQDTGVESVSGDMDLALAGPDSLYTVNAASRSGDASVYGEAHGGPNLVHAKTISGDIDISFGR